MPVFTRERCYESQVVIFSLLVFSGINGGLSQPSGIIDGPLLEHGLAVSEEPAQEPSLLHARSLKSEQWQLAALFNRSFAKQRAFLQGKCRLTRGGWCPAFHSQQPIPWFPAPRGDKPCPNDCSYTGNCNYDTGICDCPAGWGGPDCRTKKPRPCTHRSRREDEEGPVGHIDKDGRDINWLEGGWKMLRCGGICDDSIAACYCDVKEGPHKYIPPPPPSAATPYGTPPVQYARQIGQECNPMADYLGRATNWGLVPYSTLYGEQGWCNATHPASSPCHCVQDGYSGDFCEVRHEQYCPQQCSGHGLCVLGFCKCHEGWYGMDCARKRKGLPMEEGLINQRAWLKEVVAESPEVLPPSTPPPERKRPLIYIYDLPAEFTTKILQYRLGRDGCLFRMYHPGNVTALINHNLYNLELYLYEALSSSQFRTFDPEQADFFFVPPYVTCFMHPVLGAADHPWFGGGPTSLRTQAASRMLLQVLSYIKSNHPWWDHRGGKDHIWLALHDEGACWFPSAITNTSIILTHWGRTDKDHFSMTGYSADNYSHFSPPNKWLTYDWRLDWKGGKCYDPIKDLVIPSLKSPDHYRYSPLMGAPPLVRDVLFFFKGDVGLARPDQRYSRGIRQALTRAAQAGNWAEKHRFLIGFPHQLPEGYSVWLSRSKFCLVAPGDGWSARMEDAMLHGCVPVIIMDQVDVVYESILDIHQFTVRIPEAQISNILPILLSIPEQRLLRMQRRIARVWHRYAYATGPLYRRIHSEVHASTLAHGKQHILDGNPKSNHQIALLLGPSQLARTNGTSEKRAVAPVQQWPYQDDALHTIMQWLHSRIEATR